MKSLKSSLGKFNKKEVSSVTKLIEIYCGDEYSESSLEGVFEIVESISFMNKAGPIEASRALRKQLKHGSMHQNLRALTIFHGIISNGVSNDNFPDSELEARLRIISSDPIYDIRVKKKLKSVLRSICQENAQNMRFKQLFEDNNRMVPSRPSHKSKGSSSSFSSNIPKLNQPQKQSQAENVISEPEDPFADPPGTHL